MANPVRVLSSGDPHAGWRISLREYADLLDALQATDITDALRIVTEGKATIHALQHQLWEEANKTPEQQAEAWKRAIARQFAYYLTHTLDTGGHVDDLLPPELRPVVARLNKLRQGCQFTMVTTPNGGPVTAPCAISGCQYEDIIDDVGRLTNSLAAAVDEYGETLARLDALRALHDKWLAMRPPMDFEWFHGQVGLILDGKVTHK